MTEHVKLRYTMRIKPGERFDKSVIEEGVLVTLPDGYIRGIWNQSEGAVFLVGDKYGEKAVSTCIPDHDIGLSEDRFRDCNSCEGWIHVDCEELKCRFCGSTLENPSATSGDYR